MTAVSDVWEAYAVERTSEGRDALVVAYQPLVRAVAGRLAATMPSSVDVQDLVGYGNFGLIDAIDKFDPARGVKFETYAVQRIRGTIIDELRALDWAPRSVRSKARALETAGELLEHQLGRPPTEEELATAVGMSTSELRRAFQQVTLTHVARLDQGESTGESGDPGGPKHSLALASHSDHTLVPEITEAGSLLAEGIASLPSRERTVLTLYYLEGLSLRDIGTALRVSESRVSQLHTRATIALQRLLAGQAAIPY